MTPVSVTSPAGWSAPRPSRARQILGWPGRHRAAVTIAGSLIVAVALLIGAAVIGLLPVGPSLGAATAVLILGTNGVAVVAAAGALLTATGAVGALCFAAWALVDRLRPMRPAAAPG